MPTPRSHILTVFARELRDVLRDRRTLFTMLVVPVLLYPIMVLGFGALTKAQVEALEERRVKLLLLVDGAPLQPGSETPTEPFLRDLFQLPRFEFVAEVSAEEAVQQGRADVALAVPSDLHARLQRGERVPLKPIYRSSDEEAQSAVQSLEYLTEKYRADAWPVVLDKKSGDLSTADERGGRAFGGMLAMIVIMMAMTGAFYPALDLGAGEKERGTLETLLLTPISRFEIVMGKYLTVLTIAIGTALVNLLSMALTFGNVAGILGGPATKLTLNIGPQTFLVIFAGLSLIAATFSAACLALSSFARTYKEGQAWLTPLMLVVMPLSMIGLLPDMQLTPTLALIPVANLALMVKDLLVGTLDPRAGLIALVVLAGLAALALKLTTAIYQREDVLFREGPPRFGFRRPKGIRAKEQPSLGTAVAALIATLFVHLMLPGFVLGNAALKPYLLEISHLVSIGAALLLLRLSWVPIGKGLLLQQASAKSIGAGALFGLGGILLSIAAFVVSSWLLPAGSLNEANEAMTELLRPIMDRGIWALLFAAALLPAFSEEILFRGILLRGLDQGRTKGLPAVFVSAAIFALFHMDPARFLPQFCLGVALALLLQRTRSLWPCILAHALHNGLIVYFSWLEMDGAAKSTEQGLPPLASSLIIPAGLILGLGWWIAGPHEQKASERPRA